uniref:Uncharacterized protein n=1 Tax=Lepeophtheirus salmonis TaxID=72036 RepID=A0A0K2UVX4_LEPSM
MILQYLLRLLFQLQELQEVQNFLKFPMVQLLVITHHAHFLVYLTKRSDSLLIY